MYHFFLKLGMDGHCHIPYKSLEKEEALKKDIEKQSTFKVQLGIFFLY